jgi:hypothetical protein
MGKLLVGMLEIILVVDQILKRRHLALCEVLEEDV